MTFEYTQKTTVESSQPNPATITQQLTYAKDIIFEYSQQSTLQEELTQDEAHIERLLRRRIIQIATLLEDRASKIDQLPKPTDSYSEEKMCIMIGRERQILEKMQIERIERSNVLSMEPILVNLMEVNNRMWDRFKMAPNGDSKQISDMETETINTVILLVSHITGVSIGNQLTQPLPPPHPITIETPTIITRTL